MFTGIVREVGVLVAFERSDAGGRLRVRAGLASELEPGDSVAVSGVCLTVAERDQSSFAADVMNQTLRVSTLGELRDGQALNLEPALRAGEPLGGHLVQGHVDAAGEVEAVEGDGIARRLRVAIPPELRRYVVERGSVALDGASLTVVGLDEPGFEVSLVPETIERTTLGTVEPGARVNVEVDQIARYLERLVRFGEG